MFRVRHHAGLDLDQGQGAVRAFSLAPGKPRRTTPPDAEIGVARLSPRSSGKIQDCRKRWAVKVVRQECQELQRCPAC